MVAVKADRRAARNGHISARVPGVEYLAGTCTLTSAANVKSAHGLRGPLSVARPCLRPPSVAVRAKPTVPRTAPWPRFPSAMRPWTPQHGGLQRDKMTHHGTEKKRPASPWAPDFGAVWATDGGRKGHGRGRQERCPDRPQERYVGRPARCLTADLPLQAAGSLSASPSSPGPGPGSGSVVPRASVMRWLAASAWPSMQCA